MFDSKLGKYPTTISFLAIGLLFSSYGCGVKRDPMPQIDHPFFFTDKQLYVIIPPSPLPEPSPSLSPKVSASPIQIFTAKDSATKNRKRLPSPIAAVSPNPAISVSPSPEPSH